MLHRNQLTLLKLIHPPRHICPISAHLAATVSHGPPESRVRQNFRFDLRDNLQEHSLKPFATTLQHSTSTVLLLPLWAQERKVQALPQSHAPGLSQPWQCTLKGHRAVPQDSSISSHRAALSSLIQHSSHMGITRTC